MSNIHSGTASCCFYFRGGVWWRSEEKNHSKARRRWTTPIVTIVLFSLISDLMPLDWSNPLQQTCKWNVYITRLILSCLILKWLSVLPLYPQFKLLPASCYIVAVKPQLLVQKIVSMGWNLICKIYILFLLIY